MTVHFGDSTSIATATGLGANFVNSHSVTTKAPFTQSSLGEGQFTNDAISLTYAAASSSNRILVLASYCMSCSNNGHAARLYIDGNPEPISDSHGSAKRCTVLSTSTTNSQGNQCSLMYVKDSPSTSTVTYSIRLAHMDNNNCDMYLNKSHNSYTNAWHGRGTSTLTLLEFTT